MAKQWNNFGVWDNLDKIDILFLVAGGGGGQCQILRWIGEDPEQRFVSSLCICKSSRYPLGSACSSQ